MKNWVTVLVVLSSIAAVVLIAAFGATSAGTEPYDRATMAYWVQAIGSIAAIFGALRIASNQRADAERLRRQQEAADRAKTYVERLALFDLVLLLCQEAVVAIETLHDQIEVKRFPYYRSGMIGFTFREIETIATQLAHVPLEELGSPSAAKDVLRATRVLRMILSFEPVVDEVDLKGIDVISTKTKIVNRMQNIRLIRNDVDGAIALERSAFEQTEK